MQSLLALICGLSLLLPAVEPETVDRAYETGNDLALLQALLAYAEAHPEAAWPNTWKSRLRRGFEQGARQLPWERRLALVALAEAQGLSLDFDPGARDALEAARALEDPAAAAAALLAAEARGAVLEDRDLLRLCAQQIAAGELRSASETLLRISEDQRTPLLPQVWTAGLPPPALRPQLVFHSLVGGAGDQAIRSVELSADGRAIAHGPGFSLTIDCESGKGFVSGALDGVDGGEIDPAGRLRKDWKADSGAAGELHDPRDDRRYRFLTLQVHPILQQPFVACTPPAGEGWRLWGWRHGDCEPRQLMADSRLYELWLLPGGRLGVMGWTDGGNTVFAKHPRDLGRGSGIGGFGRGARVMLASIDPVSGEIERGLTVPGVVPLYRIDPWGRMLCAGDWGRRAGFQYVDTELKTNGPLPLGGAELGKAAEARIGCMVQRGRYLLLGGASRAPALRNAKHPVQERSGGDRDGLVALIRLY